MKKRMILVVDDERDLCDMFAVYFNLEGFEVRTASDGFRAMEVMQNEVLPDLVICDIRMPNCDGFCLMEELNKKIQGPPPVIILSGSMETDQDLDRLSQYSNFVDFYSKPVSINKLVQAIKDYFIDNHHAEL